MNNDKQRAPIDTIIGLLAKAKKASLWPIAHRDMLRIRRELLNELALIRLNHDDKTARKMASASLVAVRSSGCKSSSDFIHGIKLAMDRSHEVNKGER